MQFYAGLPKWLDDYIFNELGAKYCRSNADMTVIDWDKDDVLNYLGTYFPRSYAEALCIFTDSFKLDTRRFCDAATLSVLDFGCGTGGEIIGLLDAVSDCRSSISDLNIYALDGNHHALRLLERIVGKYAERSSIDVRFRVIPVVINDFYDLGILDQVIDRQFDIVMSFKAICEFVTKERFEKDNAYTQFIKTFLPKVVCGGFMLVEDVTSYNNVLREWLPRMMDKALEDCCCRTIGSNHGYNQAFMVSHSHCVADVSKVAWRLIFK